MTEEGDEQAGFRVERTPSKLSITAWGFWSVELANRFALVGRDAVAPGFSGVVQFEAAALKPMRDEGQLAWSKLLACIKASGIKSVTMINPSPLTKLQLLRLCREAGLKPELL